MSAITENMVSVPSVTPPVMETMFSPMFEHHNDAQFKQGNQNNAVVDVHPELPQLISADNNSTRFASSYAQAFNFWDFCNTDFTTSPFDSNFDFPGIITNAFQDDMDQDLIYCDGFGDYESSAEAAVSCCDDSCYCKLVQEITSKMDTDTDYMQRYVEEIDCFDTQFVRNGPDLSELELTNLVKKETKKLKPITLILDLDETLVHSTLEHWDDADFTFQVFFDMKQHTVYVKKRPHLQTFLEKVSSMFEVVIFTASQSIYAAQLLDILDPKKELFSHRMYRESCVFSDGNYTKDLTVLGIDLAKVAIIDNSPQVFRLQVNNGIPIESWFNDPSDKALLDLLPFLETFLDAEDVRPLIAKRFGNAQ